LGERFYDREAIPEHNRIEPDPIPPDELKELVEKRKWYQTIDFGDGVATPGLFKSGEHIEKILPDDMKGLRYLDIGSNQGHQVMAAAMRGAEACGIDKMKNQVEIARRLASHFGIRADFALMNLFDVPRKYEQFHAGFDFITMMSVFHHFRRPILALKIVRAMCKGRFFGEFCCWVEGEKRWRRADEFPSDWGADYHKAYPTVECCVNGLKRFFSSVEVRDPVKAKHRIAIYAEI